MLALVVEVLLMKLRKMLKSVMVLRVDITYFYPINCKSPFVVNLLPNAYSPTRKHSNKKV